MVEGMIVLLAMMILNIAPCIKIGHVYLLLHISILNLLCLYFVDEGQESMQGLPGTAGCMWTNILQETRPSTRVCKQAL